MNVEKSSELDLKMMKLALTLAKRAEKLGEVPVGAVITNANGEIIATAYNKREQLNSALGHAELLAIHRACKKINSWRLIDCTLYVTLEPCFMCSGALVQSRIKKVVFATSDPKGGALGSLVNLAEHPKLNHHFEVIHGPLSEESSNLLKNFFKAKRKK